MNIGNRPNIINPYLTNKIIDGEHLFANMPYYDITNQDENLFIGRYNELIDKYINVFDANSEKINARDVLANAQNNIIEVLSKERNVIPQLIVLCEKIVREEFNLDYDEVTFDLEITQKPIILPETINNTKRVSPRYKQTPNLDLIKKRTINALSQGASKKSHYIFHIYDDEFETLAPSITKNYNNAFIANDLMYFLIDDDKFLDTIKTNPSSNAGYSEIKFVNGKPVIIAKSICAMLLIHEMTKAVITLLSIPGIQNMSQKEIDDTDYLAAELWDLRFGPKLWEGFHSLIDPDDYNIKKLIIMQIFNKPADEFVNFMYHVLNKKSVAQKEINNIVKKIRREIMDYNMNNDS